MMALASAARPATARGELDDLTLRRAQQGEQAALGALVERYHPMVHALVWRMACAGGPSRVADLVQDAIVRVLQGLARFDPAGPARLSTWILTITTRVVLNDPHVSRSGWRQAMTDDKTETASDDDSVLADIDLRRWHVPPAPIEQRAIILERAMSPARVPPHRRTWTIAAIALGNVTLVAVVAFFVLRTPPTVKPAQVVLPGGPADAEVRQLQARLEEQQQELETQLQELEQKLAEIRELRAIADRLAEKVGELESKLPKRKTPAPTPRPMPTPRPAPARTPMSTPPPTPVASCDEVACVLDNYQDRCCARFKRASSGFLILSSKPPARIFVDGVDTGKTTPISRRAPLELAPGNHKVTFVVADDEKYVTTVSIESGQTLAVVKDFSGSSR